MNKNTIPSVTITNIKLLSKDEEDELIDVYTKNIDVPYDSTGLRKHVPIAAGFKNRSFIKYDSVVQDQNSTIKSNFGFIILYGKTKRMISDGFNNYNEAQRRAVWNRHPEIISAVREGILASKRKIYQFNYNTILSNEKKYAIKKFHRGGKEVFLCLVRNIFTPATEEEIVRQSLLKELLVDSQIPKEFIKVEENMSHYYKGAKDRADIIILHPETEDPWILFELKAPSVSIDQNTLDQAKKYQQILNCKFLCLFNQINEEWYISENREFRKIKKPKAIDDLLESKIEYIIEEKFSRPSFEECHSDKIIKEFMYGRTAIGDRTPPHLHPFIVNFYSMLIEELNFITKIVELPEFSIIEDGIREATFGNASGGKYDGVYRYFILKFPNSENNILSISIFGAIAGHTSLNVAIDDYDKSHNSLQLQLDKNVIETNGKWFLYHDGKLTKGKQGSAKVSEVINFCKNYIPDMVKSNRILIGSLPNNELFNWVNAQHIIVNLIRYALVRDKFRNQF